MPNEIAPKGKVFVCAACGKRSRDQYGEQKIDPWWDESCMLNCVLVDESDLIIRDGRVVGTISGLGRSSAT
jgi:hypothetical protein